MPVVDAWQAVCSQWRATSLAGGGVLWHGLDYSAVDIGLNRAGCTLSPAEWSCLRLMERIATSVLNGTRG